MNGEGALKPEYLFILGVFSHELSHLRSPWVQCCFCGVINFWCRESSCLLLRNYLLDPNTTTSTPSQLLENPSAMIHIMHFCFCNRLLKNKNKTMKKQSFVHLPGQGGAAQQERHIFWLTHVQLLWLLEKTFL